MKTDKGHACSDDLEKVREQERQRIVRSLNPHFLFNTLGAIRIATKTNADLAYDMIYDFSKYLRVVIRMLTYKGDILFKEETAHIISYINLEKIRFGDNIAFHMDIKAQDFMLPPLLLQPLVENAVRHGLKNGRLKGVITIRSYQTPAEYIVQVEDDGIGFEAESYSRLPAQDGLESGGLQRVRYLIEKMAGGSMDIQSFIGIGTIVTLHIPKVKQ